MNDEQLHAGIRQAGRAAGTPPPDLARTVLHRRRRQHRQTVGIVGAALAVLLVAVGVPVAYSALTSGGPTAVAAADRVVQGVDTRGGLAADNALLSGLQQLPWIPADTPTAAFYSLDVASPPVSSPYYVATDLAAAVPAADRRVVWADDVPGGRWALLAIPTAGGWAAAWFTGPEGASAQQMLISGPVQLVTDTEPLAHIDLANPAKTLVIVGAPNDSFSITDRVDVAADGSPVQEYRELPATEGVSVTTLTTDLRYGVAATVQAVNPERTWRASPTASGSVAGVPAGAPGGWSDGDVELPNILARGTTSAATSRILSDAMLASILGPTGLTLHQIADTGPQLTELTSSFRFDDTTFPSTTPGGEQRQGFIPQPTVTMWDLELPSGAHAVMAGWSADTDDNTVAGEDTAASYQYALTLLTIQAADFDPAVDLVATTMDIPALGDQPAVSIAVIAGTPDGTTARFLDEDGAYLGDLSLVNGSVVVASPPPGFAGVAVVDDQGDVLQTAPLSSGVLDLTPTGAQPTYLTEPVTAAAPAAAITTDSSTTPTPTPGVSNSGVSPSAPATPPGPTSSDAPGPDTTAPAGAPPVIVDPTPPPTGETDG